MQKFCSLFLTLILILSLSLSFLCKTSVKHIAFWTSANVYNRQTVIIDAGHGGFDGGAVAVDGTMEKDINLKIALKTGELLSFAGYNVIYTRKTDVSTDSVENGSRKKSDLQNRLEIMNNNPDAVFVSIHLNKFTETTANGAQMFYSPGFSDAKVLAENIQESVVSLIQQKNHRVVKKGNKSTYLLHNASVPAVIVECGFLSNQKDLELLKDEQYQTKMAYAVFCGILNYFKDGNNG